MLCHVTWDSTVTQVISGKPVKECIFVMIIIVFVTITYVMSTVHVASRRRIEPTRYRCAEVTCHLPTALGFHFTVIVVVIIVLYLLPFSSLYTAWAFIKEKPPDDTSVWLNVTTSRRKRPSHCFPIIRPSCVVCKLRPVLRITQSDDCQETRAIETHLLTSMFSRKPSPITLTRRQRPLTPSAHASSPSCSIG
jgi:hypothetical protein